MNKQKLYRNLLILESDCRILKNCNLNDDINNKLEQMQLILTGLILEVKKK